MLFGYDRDRHLYRKYMISDSPHDSGATESMNNR